MTDEQIRQKYNSFTPEQRDMSFKDFKKAIKNMQDTGILRQDLAKIQTQKAVFNANKARIDRGLN